MDIEHVTNDVGGATHEDTARPGDSGPPGGPGLPEAAAGGRLATLRRVLAPLSRRQGGSVWRLTVVAVATYAITLSAAYFLLMKPIRARLGSLVETKSVLQDFLIVRESASAVSQFKDGLMHGDQRMTVVSEFEDLARDAGLRMIGDTGLLPEKELSSKLVEYPVELDFRGAYHEVGEFLSQLSSSPRCPLVREVDVTAVEGGYGQCDVRLLIGIASWVD